MAQRITIAWGAIKGAEEKISPEIFSVFDNTINTHDVFGDGSAVATYNFDGDATDLGGTYNGTWHGNESYVEGLIGQAASFDGSSRIKTMIPLNSSIIFSVWLSIDSSQQVKYAGLFSTGVGSVSTPSIICDSRGLGVNSGSGDIYGIPTSIIPQNQYFHVYFYLDNMKDNMKIMINGEEIGTYQDLDRTSPSGYSMGDLNTQQIAWAGSLNYYLKGKVDQLRIFNRDLTQTEVTTLYKEGA